MSIAVGIDAGYDSHVVARMVVPTELTSEPTIEIQKNESNESEFKCQMEYTDALLKICDKVSPIDETNFEAVAKFTIEYFRNSLNTENEKNFSGVSLENKDGKLYMIFKSKESEKELTIPAAYGIQFLYEFFCIANSGGSSDLLFTTMTQNDWKTYLQSMKSMVSIPSFFTDVEVGSLRACFTAFGLPESSFVCRSLPLAISGCYSLWKDEYTKDKMVKRNYAVIDFGATGTSVYLVSFKRHHMKIKCHLHSNEACVRNLELGLAEAICSCNPEHEELFASPANRYHALELAKKYLPQFNNAKTEFIRVTDSDGFVLNGEKVEFNEKIQRKAFLKACEKTGVLEAYTKIIALFITVLTQSKIAVNRILPFGSVVNMDEIKMMVSKQFSGHATDKRLSNPANRGEAVAEGTLLLYHLIATNQAAVDPQVVKRVFWPSAELEQQNKQGSEKPGILKIFYTRTNVSEEVVDDAAVSAMTEELTQFVTNQVEEEGRRYNLHSNRAKLLADYQRVLNNLNSTKRALELKEAEEAAKRSVIQPEKEKTSEENPEKEKEENPEKTSEDTPEKTSEENPEKTSEKTPEKTPEETPKKSDALMALEKEEEKLAAIEALIQSDKYLCTTPDAVNELLQQLNECDNPIHLLATGLEGVVLEERPVEKTLEIEKEEKPKKKRRGCCKGKGDVVEMGA